MNDSKKNPCCECPTERHDPTGIGNVTTVCDDLSAANSYGWSQLPSAFVRSGPDLPSTKFTRLLYDLNAA